MNRLTIVGAVNSFTGYGKLVQEVAVGLRGFTNHHVVIRSIRTTELFGAQIPAQIHAMMVNQPQPEDFELIIHPPIFAPTPGKRTVFFTMWETTRLPKDSVAMLNKCEAVIVPTQWNAETFSAAGVDVPIYVVPLGYDQRYFKVAPMRHGPFTFGVSGNMDHSGPRKGVSESIECFLEEFRTEQDVRMVVKVLNIAPDRIDDPRVIVQKGWLSDEKMAEWFDGISVFLSNSRGEGFGLLQMEAMARQRPVISSLFGGVSSFLNHENAFIFKHTLEKPDMMPYDKCGLWAVPDRVSVKKQMRAAYSVGSALHKKAANALITAVPYTWSNTVFNLVGVLRKIGAIT